MVSATATHVGFTILTVACWLSVASRVYVRRFIVRPMSASDWLIIFTCTCLTGIVAVAWLLTSLGMGKHVYELDQAALPTIIPQLVKLFYINEILYVTATLSLKLSIALLLLRFILRRVPRRIVIYTSVFYLVYGILFLFVIVLQCIPVNSRWDSTVDGNCIAPQTLTGLVFMHAAVSLIGDGIFAILPMWIVSSIQMSMRTKISISMVLGLGLTTAGVNISRFFFIAQLYVNDDISYNQYLIGVTSWLEIGIGIIAASLATLRPLLRKFGCSRTVSGSNTTKQPSMNLVDGGSLEMGTTTSLKTYDEEKHLECSCGTSPITSTCTRDRDEMTPTSEDWSNLEMEKLPSERLDFKTMLSLGPPPPG